MMQANPSNFMRLENNAHCRQHDYSTHIGPDLAGNINTDNKLPFEHYLGNRYEREFNFNLTTAGEVLHIIN